jgi:hypothetical protein
VARYGPPEDFHNQPTRHANFGMVEQPPPGEPAPTDQPPGETQPEQFEPAQSVDPFDQETEPTAWYRKPAVLIGWALLVLILIALIVYGITELLEGQQGTSHVPSTSTTPPTSTHHTTPPTATTTTPPTSSAVGRRYNSQPSSRPSSSPPSISQRIGITCRNCRR